MISSDFSGAEVQAGDGGERQSMEAGIQAENTSYAVCSVCFKFSTCTNLILASAENLLSEIFLQTFFCVHAVGDV